MNSEAITHEALSLPVQQRAELAVQLLSSLDMLFEAEIDQGLSGRIPAEDVRRQASALLS